MDDSPGADPKLSERLLEDDSAAQQQQLDDVMAGEIIVDPLQAGHGLRGETQTPQYRDTPFAAVFLVQLFVVFFLAVFWGFGSLKQDEVVNADDAPVDDTLSLWGFFFLLFLVSSSSIGIAAASLDFMTSHAEHLMQASLMISCVVLAAVVVLLFANDSSGFGFCWLFVLICTGLYAYSVQDRIPFASANLRTALSAIQTNYGVCMMAYGVGMAANLWVVIWLLAFLGVAFRSSTCTDGSCDMHVSTISFVLLLLSYFWTSQVLQVSNRRECAPQPSVASLITFSSCCHCSFLECDPCDRQRSDWNLVVCTTRGPECFLSCHSGLVLEGHDILVRQHLLWKSIGGHHSGPGADRTQRSASSIE